MCVLFVKSRGFRDFKSSGDKNRVKEFQRPNVFFKSRDSRPRTLNIPKVLHRA